MYPEKDFNDKIDMRGDQLEDAYNWLERQEQMREELYNDIREAEDITWEDIVNGLEQEDNYTSEDAIHDFMSDKPELDRWME